ncbi:hypothetical protein HAP48_0010710 [Bradyrhizobium septentrionale]|uniref:Uncharacterized protein n=1 Tax=Bradyrhizobium septentrionale TaxID=1404411 RepID=A0A973W8H7_9BRAD|nr:hypothetical protein [Bradyrhizobium septentrionale]UGY17858.1 hypothetical protein HAP48_0010710 [Bradyrhizobium septentrionale]UGY26593.1 hypothetical protein HU675_0007430 [Bradyrhizobium septentrionale]
MLQNLLASIGVLAIIIVTFARMTFQARRPPQEQLARSKTLQTLRRRRPF